MDNVNNEVVEFYKKLGYTLIEIKSSIFREEESTLVFQTDNKNHTVDGSTILYDHAVALHHQLQKAVQEEKLKHCCCVIENSKVVERCKLHGDELQKAREKERERIEAIFKKHVPPHAMDLEDSVWLKRLLNKAFNHDKNI